MPDFLEQMSKLYEMHVYTAGSRSYANAVCKGIDPNGKYFSERILSRDESGSECASLKRMVGTDISVGAAVKNLKRLFPTDQSMVVIIDDRWEVWSHGPNLVKVVPCKSRTLRAQIPLILVTVDFFVGMGDINSTYVKPRASDIPAAMGPVAPDVAEEEDSTLQDQIALKRAKALEDQLEARPLKRKQEELEKQTEGKATHETGSDGVQPVESEEAVTNDNDTTHTGNGADSEGTPHQRQALLRNDDNELSRVDKVCPYTLSQCLGSQ